MSGTVKTRRAYPVNSENPNRWWCRPSPVIEPGRATTRHRGRHCGCAGGACAAIRGTADVARVGPEDFRLTPLNSRPQRCQEAVQRRRTARSDATAGHR
jgi:hypothetical protein